MQQHVSLYIKASEVSGRGVFCRQALAPGQLIEVCPVIVLPRQDIRHLDQTRLYDYYFIWGEHDEQAALILGFGSMYNHSFEPNAEYRPDYTMDTLSFYALHPIPADTEITVNYNGTPGKTDELWFTAK